MFGKIKKIFFTGIFGLLYTSYIAQFVYVLVFLNDIEHQVYGLALLALEWLVLIAARYLSKKSSSNAQQYSGGFRRH
jgi:hypothetical protein